MGDHVPIGTLVGSVSPDYVGLDVVVAELPVANTITRLFLRRSDHLAGDALVASLRNAPGGGGAGIQVTLSSGVAYASASGSLPIAAGGLVYLRVASSGASSMNLQGDFEIEKAAGVLTYLTNLARVKQWLKLDDESAHDAILTTLIAGVSRTGQQEMGRSIVARDVVAEIHDGSGCSDTLQLREWPIRSSPAPVVRVNGTVLDAGLYQVLRDRAWLVRAVNGSASPWTGGRLAIQVDYPSGYDEVPEDLALAATEQVAFVFRQSAPGGDRLGSRGSTLDLAGSSQYLTGEWAPGVQETFHRHRNWVVG